MQKPEIGANSGKGAGFIENSPSWFLVTGGQYHSFVVTIIFASGAKALHNYISNKKKEKHLPTREYLGKMFLLWHCVSLVSAWFFQKVTDKADGEAVKGELQVGSFPFQLEQKYILF